ncbi:MAG: hypothetical protein IPH97_17095 [Ignavibacteriales bacterium]|nr:hypothetical protein [Ignavibacteriales bacterium]
MKNHEEKYFDYLKGKMNPNEKKLFEDELQSSDSLRKSFEDYKTLIQIIDKTKNIKLNPDYTQSIVPDFRNKVEVKKFNQVIPKLKYALSFVAVAVLSFYFVYDITTKDSNDITTTLAELSTEEMNIVSESIDVSASSGNSLEELSMEKIDALYSEQLSKNILESSEEKTTGNILNGYELSDVEDYLSDDDIEKIYTQLIDKEIL